MTMASVKPIPEGYHTVSPMYCVKGASEFIKFCKKTFGAEERMRMPGPNNMVMHAEIKIGDSIIMVTDALRDAPTTAGTHLYVKDCDTIFKNALANGAKELMPLANQVWGDRMGRFEDKWGNRWGIATHVEDVTMAEVQTRMAAQQQKAQQK